MTLLEEIRDGFASMASDGALRINSLEDEYGRQQDKGAKEENCTE